jgi:hypothetical protein
VKFKTALFLLSLSVLVILQISYSKVQAETVVLFKEAFNVPGPGKHNLGEAGQGIERPFTLNHKSTVTLAVATNKQKPSLNVYLLDADNYSKYQSSGSLTNLDVISPFTKLDTLAFETTGDLAPGKYVLIIQWAHIGLFYTAPAVGLKLIAKEHEEPIPTPTPKGFWSGLFSGNK